MNNLKEELQKVEDKLPQSTNFEAFLSNGETLKGKGEIGESWEQARRYIESNKLTVIGLRIVARSRFYHLPTKSPEYRYDSKPPVSLEVVKNENTIGIKANYTKYSITLWVDKKQNHSWIQVKENGNNN